jgi:hypothetical protein
MDADDKIWGKLQERHPELTMGGANTAIVVPMHKNGWRRIMPVAAAAIIVAVVAGLGYMWMRSNDSHKKVAKTQQPQTNKSTDKAPGKDGAFLKLSNGQEIVLDDAANGVLAQQGNTTITKQDGALVYNSTIKNSEVLYNTLTTPRGRKFKLVLPDGSSVWFNAASSIKFPVCFWANERRVEITGEAYFEIAQNAQSPFIVTTNGTSIRVLGTKFNVNAYHDEAMVKTTLVEGRVQINDKQTAILKPGQQAQVKDGEVTIVEKADMNAALAWKNGLFVFNSATDIKEVLRQIGRWYDVDIEYAGDINVPTFYGEIPRTLSLANVLKIIEMNGKLKFTINGNKVIVTQS